MFQKVKGQFTVGTARGDFYNSNRSPIVTDLGKDQYLFSIGGSERVFDAGKMRLGDSITGVVQGPTIAKLTHGTYVTVDGQTTGYPGTGLDVLRYDAEFKQIGTAIDVIDYTVPRNGDRSFSVDARSKGFVVQWIDDRVYTGKIPAPKTTTQAPTGRIRRQWPFARPETRL